MCLRVRFFGLFLQQKSFKAVCIICNHFASALLAGALEASSILQGGLLFCFGHSHADSTRTVVPGPVAAAVVVLTRYCIQEAFAFPGLPLYKCGAVFASVQVIFVSRLGE